MGNKFRRHDPAYWVLVILAVIALFLSGFSYSGWQVERDRLVNAQGRIEHMDKTISDYHDQFALNQLEFNAINTGLNIRRHEVAQFRDQRDKNWSRLVGVCTELRVRGHDNAACRGIE